MSKHIADGTSIATRATFKKRGEQWSWMLQDHYDVVIAFGNFCATKKIAQDQAGAARDKFRIEMLARRESIRSKAETNVWQRLYGHGTTSVPGAIEIDLVCAGCGKPFKRKARDFKRLDISADRRCCSKRCNVVLHHKDKDHAINDQQS